MTLEAEFTQLLADAVAVGAIDEQQLIDCEQLLYSYTSAVASIHTVMPCIAQQIAARATLAHCD